MMETLTSMMVGVLLSYIAVTAGIVSSEWRELLYSIKAMWYMKKGQYTTTFIQEYRGMKDPAIMFKDFGIIMVTLNIDGEYLRNFHCITTEGERVPEMQMMVRQIKLGWFDSMYFFHNRSKSSIMAKLEPVRIMLEDL